MVVEAVRQCNIQNVDFDKTFQYQYVVSNESLCLPGFSDHLVGNFCVQTGAKLQVATLQDRDGRTFGLCLGIAVDHSGVVLGDQPIKDVVSTETDVFDQFERYLKVIAGRYAIIVHVAEETRFYCDSVGMIGAVYAPETRRIAASPLLCIDRPIVDHPLYDHTAIEQGRGTYGLLHTRDQHVHRLNANHYMNLDHFFHRRFWPKNENFDISKKQYADNFDELIEATGKVISAIAKRYKTAMPLTGGNDTRILFALAGVEGRQQVNQYFAHINNYATRRDAFVGQQLCELKGLSFEQHDRKKNNVPIFTRKRAVKQYHIASGANTPAPKEIQNGLVQRIEGGSVVMRGHQTNIMRGQYLITSDSQKWLEDTWQIRMMRLVGDGEFNSEVAARFRPDFQKCFGDLPENALSRAADFMFLETLVPSALGILFPGQPDNFYLSPFNSRRLVELSLGFDAEYRLANHTTYDLLLRADPEIARLPFAFELSADLSGNTDTEKPRSRYSQSLIRNEQLFGR